MTEASGEPSERDNIDCLTERFPSGETVPNNPDLPLVLCRGVLSGTDEDRASGFESRYRNNQWGGTWRNGIFSYHHYHSTAHEVLGVARGRARVMFGGPQGREFQLEAGDMAVLPAGTGHKNIESSSGLLVVGGYPLGQNADLKRGDSPADDGIREAIRSVPLPESDPVFGPDGPLIEAWT